MSSTLSAGANERGPIVGDAESFTKYGATGDVLNSTSEKGRRPVAGFASIVGLDSLQREFGWKLLVLLFSVNHLMRGFAQTLTTPCVSFLFASYNVPGPLSQTFQGLTMLPWSMKPVFALLSDAFPIMGYNKAPYMFLVTVSGVAASCIVGAVPQDHLSLNAVVICLFIVTVQLSVCDLLTEAKYAEKMRAKPKHGPSLMTFVFFGANLAALLATALIGPLLSNFGPKVPFLVALLPMSFVLIPLMLNYLEEQPRSLQERQAARRQLMEQKEAVLLCLFVFVGTIVLTFSGIHGNIQANAIASICVTLAVVLAFCLVLNPTIARFSSVVVLQSSMALSIQGSAFYFFTDNPEQYPEGPHLSQGFFVGVLGMVGAITALLGIAAYRIVASEWSFQTLFILSNLALCVFTLLDIIMFSRLNVGFGLPDAAFVLGSNVLTTASMQWMYLPGVVLMSQLCPTGMEATMFALLASCHSLGRTVSGNVGAWLLELLGCQPSGALNEGAQFKNLWVACLIASLLPLGTVLLVPYCIPAAKQTEKLLDDSERSATKGSPLQRWLRH